MYKSLFECDLATGDRHDTAVVLGWYPLNKFVREFDKSSFGVLVIYLILLMGLNY